MDKAGVSTTDTLAGGSDLEQFIEAETLEPGAMVAKRYRVIRQMSRDDVGVSVLVEDIIWGEEIVLKFLHRDVASDESWIKRFIHELRDARKIAHANVLHMYDLLLFGASYALSLEHFSGHSLAEELRQGPLNVRRGLRIAWDICRGLNAAHQVGIIHRELTPSYIMVNYTGGVKVVRNFVSARSIEAEASEEDMLLRAPRYLAPEHVRRGILDARTNIYSLGVIMYEMFTGKPPYVADDPVALLLQHVEGKPTPLRQLRPELLPELETVILKTMAVDPAQRFQTTDDVRRSLVVLFRQAPEPG
jgi:eukaryotic-like serine/threonine-protein kinase